MVRCAAVSILALILAAAQPADAKCAGPGVAFAPESGDTAGVTWVFVPSYSGAKIEVASSVEMHAEITEVSDNDTFRAYRVSVSHRVAGALGAGDRSYNVRVVGQYGTEDTASYRLTGDRRPYPGPALLADGRYDKDAWTCSHTDAVTARPSVDAWAYRIEWARTEAAYRAGDREILVVPASMKAFWGGAEAPRIELGHLNCFGETIPADALAETAYLGIIPLGPWAEGDAPDHPIAVRSGEPPRIEVVQPVAEPEPASTTEYPCGHSLAHALDTAPRPSPGSLPLGLLLALAGALAGLPLGIRASRRLDRDTADRLDALSLPQIAVVAGVISMAACAPIAAAGGFIAGASASIAGAVTASRRDRAV
jgi:hypothetical protein